MANTNINKLPTFNVTPQNSRNWYVYAADGAGLRNVRVKVSDFFTSLSSVAGGVGLLNPTGALKGLTSESPITLRSSGDSITIGYDPSSIGVGSFTNDAGYLQEVNLTDPSTTGLLSITNGGTGADNQQAAINLLTNSASASNTQLLSTDGTNALWYSIDSVFTASTGLAWDTTSYPYKLKVDLSDVTFSSDISFNNHMSTNGFNIGIGGGWLSNDKGSEGINIDSEGRVFMGYSSPTASFDANSALNLSGNLTIVGGAARTLAIGNGGNDFNITGSTPSASNTAGGDITIAAGAGTGSGAGGTLTLKAGGSGSGDGNISLFVTDAGTSSEVLRVHGSNKHFTIGSTGVNNNAKLDIQNDTAGAACLELDQNDTDEPFIIYTGATGTSGAANIDTEPDGDTSGSTVAAPHSATWTLKGMTRINVNGTDFWTPYYTR